MMSIIASVMDLYQEFMDSGDPRVIGWPLMSGPGPTIALVVSYVLFVKKFGPMWMADRKPFQLRHTMLIYNVLLVLINFYLLFETFRILFTPPYSWFCRIDDKSDPDSIKIAELGWLFFFIKFVEFADTVFFVLRKKNEHISTLHLVHHAVVPIAVWGGLRTEPGSYNYFFPLLNTIVHTVMYSYYGLAALGPSVQKYLWWKKYLTSLQIIQFITVFFYLLSLIISDCKVSKFIIYLNSFLAGLFLTMFLDYFYNTYLKHRHHNTKIELKNGKLSKPALNGNGLVVNGNSAKTNESLKKNGFTNKSE